MRTKESVNNHRGVRKLPARVGRPNPYGVQFRVEGKVKTEFFPSESARDDRFADLVAEKKRGATPLTRDDVSAWTAFKATTEGAAWQDVVAGWKSWQQHLGLRVSPVLLVKDAVKDYLAIQATRKISPDTLRQKKRKLTDFAAAFGENAIDRVTAEDITEWLEDGKGFDNGVTFDDWVGHVTTLYTHFKVPSPCDQIESRGGHPEFVNILSVEDTARLFAYAHKHKRSAIGRLALEFFAGLRFSSATRLDIKDINFEDRGILLPAKKLKTGMVDGRRHYIDGLPDNLWAWLKVATPDAWTMTGSEWMHEKTDLFNEAKVPHPRNCARHSFATYHVAAFKNPGLTATLLCHTNQQKLWSNYNGNATQAAGKAYFGIKPYTQQE